MNEGQRWEYNVDPLHLSDKAHATRVLNMAAEDGWEVVAVVPLSPEGEKVWAYVIYRRELGR